MPTEDLLGYGARLFESERFRLRSTTEQDCELLHTWWLDPLVMVLQSPGAALLKDRDSILSMFRDWSQVKDSGLGYSIALRETNQLIGHVALWGITPKDQCANFGILLNREVWGQGYGTEAILLVLHYSFRELNLHRVQLEASAENTRAIHCYQKAGFREEGRRRQAHFRDGKWQDQIMMGILADEFKC
jgi:RimJ/RimL family protein N-acetyltransferase